MRNVWTQFLGMFMIVALASGGIYTNAFFFDTEKGDPNVLAATSLNSELFGESISDAICVASGEAETELLVENSGALPFTYDLLVDNATGSACGGLNVQAFKNDTLQYDGPITGLLLSDQELETNGDDVWRVKVKFPTDAAGSCTFDTLVSAHQSEFLGGEAYYDTERITHTVSVDTGPACGPTVDLHLTKAISGDNQGYEFSDFSYRVVGEGVDTVVPHDETVALPIGTYTIEELVPDGFVKGDWRIGWYGQCDAGDTFTTSITIDEGNVDHGILYCQADNQYRPENNDDEEVETQTTSSGDTSEPRRTQRTSRSSTEESEETTGTTSDDGTDPETTASSETTTGGETSTGTDGDASDGTDGTDGADGESGSSVQSGDETEETTVENQESTEEPVEEPEEETEEETTEEQEETTTGEADGSGTAE